MSIFERSHSPWTGRMLSILRIVAGLIFVSAGTMKVFGYPPGPPACPPSTYSRKMGTGGLLEVIGGLVDRARPPHPAGRLRPRRRDGGRLLSVPRPPLGLSDRQRRHPAVLYCFLFLYFTFAGAGHGA